MPSPQAIEIERRLRQNHVGDESEMPTISERRAAVDKMGQWASARNDVSTYEVKLGNVQARVYTPDTVVPGLIVLYLHGGGYVMGSFQSHGRLMAHFSHHSSAPLYGLDIRLAPEHPFPAALEDSVSAYDALLASGWRPEQIVLAGDSAGGGLVLAVLAIIRETHRPMPAGGVLLSPWLDLTLTSSPTLTTLARLYAGEAALDDPKLSPVYMDFSSLPPLLIHVSSTETFFPDAARARDLANAAGVDVTFQAWEGLTHVFQLHAGHLPEAKESFFEIANWMSSRRQTSVRSSRTDLTDRYLSSADSSPKDVSKGHEPPAMK